MMLRFCLQKLMSKISNTFLCDATLSRSILERVVMKKDGRIFEGFIALLRYAFS